MADEQPFTVTVTGIDLDASGSDVVWNLSGELELAGDTYQVAHEFVEGEYGGHSTRVSLDGVAQDEQTYFERTVGRDAISDLFQEVIWDVFEAQRIARDEAIASVVGIRQVVA